MTSYEPTEEEIAEACEHIREAWTPAERAKRAGGREVTGWEVPVLLEEELGLEPDG